MKCRPRPGHPSDPRALDREFSGMILGYLERQTLRNPPHRRERCLTIERGTHQQNCVTEILAAVRSLKSQRSLADTSSSRARQYRVRSRSCSVAAGRRRLGGASSIDQWSWWQPTGTAKKVKMKYSVGFQWTVDRPGARTGTMRPLSRRTWRPPR